MGRHKLGLVHRMRERGTTFINRGISMKRISKVATVLIGVIGVALALPMGSALTASEVMAQGNTPGCPAQCPRGTQGKQGKRGKRGKQGVQGPAGATGLTGPLGPAGLTGSAGPQGLPGTAGLTGARGPQGLQGLQGLQGEPGICPPCGTPGPSGLEDLTRTSGPPGEPASIRFARISADGILDVAQSSGVVIRQREGSTFNEVNGGFFLLLY